MKRHLLHIIVTTYTLLITWALIIPPLEIPDEQAHFATVNFFTNERRIPTIYKDPDLSKEIAELEQVLGTYRDDKGINKHTYHPEYILDYTDGLYGKHEVDIRKLNTLEAKTTYVKKEAARYPPNYYKYLSPIYRLLYENNIFIRLYSARIATVFLSTLTIIFTYLIGRTLFDKKVYALSLAIITLLQPMMSFVSSGINSDTLHNLLFTALIYTCLLIINSSKLILPLLSSVIIIWLNIYTKPQGLIGIPLVFLAIILRATKTKKIKSLLKPFLLLLPPLIYFAKDKWIIYSNDLLCANLKSVNFLDHLKFSLNKLYAQNLVWYWGVFKWLGIVLPRWSWGFANRFVLIALIGILFFFYKKLKKKATSTNLYNVIFLVLTTLIYIAAIFFADWAHVKKKGFSLGIQARYYFPTISAHMALFLIGITELAWNKRVKSLLRKFLTIFMLLMQLVGIYTLASSYYTLWPLSTFITQTSQYKPFFAKGNWLKILITIYFISLVFLAKTIIQGEKNKKS